LELQQGKYYVGKTSDVARRLQEHRSGNGSEWTKRYPLIRLIHSEQNTDPFDEDKFTKKLMSEKGIENVRGGAYSQLNLTEEQITLINRELRGAQDQCLKCGRVGHMVRNCPENTGRNQAPPQIQNRAREETRRQECRRCGRSNHTGDNCYAQFDIDRNPLPCARCGRDNHITDECYAKTNINGRYLG
jgi:hypothetical protein